MKARSIVAFVLAMAMAMCLVPGFPPAARPVLTVEHRAADGKRAAWTLWAAAWPFRGAHVRMGGRP